VQGISDMGSHGIVTAIGIVVPALLASTLRDLTLVYQLGTNSPIVLGDIE